MRDPFLEKRLVKYDEWLSKEQISYSSKVIPVSESRHVSLMEDAEILKKANESDLVYLTLYQPKHEIYAICSCCSGRKGIYNVKII